ncbi:MAG: PilZ domain-containing protein [Candidatus Aureabacteria bacterium]|nr:PilZ domain-containing protein [Candidatus Auribacterota bacterium]
MDSENKEIITDQNFIRKYLVTGESLFVFIKIGTSYQFDKTYVFSCDEERFLIQRPYQKGQRVILTPGMEFFFKLFPFEGYFEFSCICGEILTFKGKECLVFPYPSSLTRIQRRQAFRVPISLPGKFVIKSSSCFIHDVTVTDLSVAGARISANFNVTADSEGTLSFLFPVQPPVTFSVPVRIQRAQKITNERSNYAFSYGLLFLSLTSVQEKILSRYVNEVQLRHHLSR